MKLTKEQINTIKETLQIELLKRGFTAQIVEIEEVKGRHNDTRVEFKTENFQTVPVIFKEICVRNFSSAITMRDHVRADGEVVPFIDVWINVNVDYNHFGGGSNGCNLFDINIEFGTDGNERPWNIKIR